MLLAEIEDGVRKRSTQRREGAKGDRVDCETLRLCLIFPRKADRAINQMLHNLAYG